MLRDVPPSCTVVGIPGRPVSRKQDVRLSPLEHGKLPDLEATVICSLLQRVEQLEKQLENLNIDAPQKEILRKQG